MVEWVMRASQALLLEGRRGVGMRRGQLDWIALGVVREDEVDAYVVVIDLGVEKLSRIASNGRGGHVVRESWYTGCLTKPIRPLGAESRAFRASAIAAGYTATGGGMITGIGATIFPLKLDWCLAEVV